jgi:hypothetical protein
VKLEANRRGLAVAGAYPGRFASGRKPAGVPGAHPAAWTLVNRLTIVSGKAVHFMGLRAATCQVGTRSILPDAGAPKGRGIP